jgi:hypothetical protein
LTSALSTMCEPALRCLGSAGFILCSTDADCPNFLPTCCGNGNLRICGPSSCGGRGGGGGPGPGAGGGGRGGRGRGGGGAPPGGPPAPPA